MSGCRMDARPHPGPLPQERENRQPPFGNVTTLGTRPLLEANERKTGLAELNARISRNVNLLSLSPGERAGVHCH